VRSRLEDVLARQLRELAREKRIPLSHVADRAGVSRSYFWLLLDGENSATLSLVQKIADALDVEPLTLLGAGQDDARKRDTSGHRRDRPRVERAAAETREVRPPTRQRRPKPIRHR
jgi:transcriptional regulator with XRE-family HTH domain